MRLRLLIDVNLPADDIPLLADTIADQPLITLASSESVWVPVAGRLMGATQVDASEALTP
jgi:hypothetical protein